MSIGLVLESVQSESMGKISRKRPGRKPSKIDERAKLERNRQRARECRARKKLRYQYLEEFVRNREKAVYALRDELETCKQWCLMLDKGGPLPDSLIKAVVNKETAKRNQQIGQAQQLLQLQQCQQHVSSSSSYPPTTFQQTEHHKSPQSQLQGYLPNLSPPLQPAQSGSQLQFQLLQTRQPATEPPLKRQKAFDMSGNQDMPGTSQINFLPSASELSQTSTGQKMFHPASECPSTSTGQQKFHPASECPSTSTGQQMLPQIYNAGSRQKNVQFGQRVHSEPPFHYGSKQAVYNSPLGPRLSPAHNLQISNPSAMTSYPRINLLATQGGSGQTPKSESVQSLSLFSGTKMSSKIPSFVTADDGSSSGENIDGEDLFQFSAQNNRPLSDPVLPEKPKKLETVTETPAIDIMHDSFVNITSFGFSSTSSSSMSYGMAPVRTASPSTFKYSGRLTPSSSATSSPAPSFSLYPAPSAMEYAQSPLTSYTYEKPSSVTAAGLPPTCTASDMSAGSPCLPNALSASVMESINIDPYLDYFANDNLPSLNSLFQEDSSSQNFTRTPTELNNPSTPSFNIIDEFLDNN